MHKKSLYAGLLALSTFSAGPAFAATLVDFTFDGPISGFANPGNDATVAPAINGLTFSPWSVRDGAVVTTLLGRGSALAIGANSFDASGTPGNQFSFKITLSAGKSLSLAGYSFDEQASRVGGGNGAGPNQWNMFINNVSVLTAAENLAGGASTSRGSYATRAGDLTAFSGLSGVVNVRISAAGGELPSSTWRIDNFKLTGTVVPVPASLPLLVGALGLLGVARRRRG